MAIYTTFFLCDPVELLDGFPGWRMPLDNPVRREVRNPFTGEMMVIESRAPEWPDSAASPVFNYQATEIEGPYEAYLETRLPSFVQQRSHWAAKGLTPVEINPLLEILAIEDEIEMAIYSPPTSGDCIEVFPDAFLAKLTSLDLEQTSHDWAEALSTPEHTHSVSGVKLSDGWTKSDAMEILDSIVKLGCKAQSLERLYLLTEA